MSPEASATSGGSLLPPCTLLIPSNAGGEINFSDGGTLVAAPTREDDAVAIARFAEAIPRAVLGEAIFEDSITFFSSREAKSSAGGVGELASSLASSKASGSGRSSSGS